MRIGKNAEVFELETRQEGKMRLTKEKNGEHKLGIIIVSLAIIMIIVIMIIVTLSLSLIFIIFYAFHQTATVTEGTTINKNHYYY